MEFDCGAYRPLVTRKTAIANRNDLTPMKGVNGKFQGSRLHRFVGF